jgi:type I restriction enzyme S subunit
MAGEWRETTLGEVIELKRGYDLPQQERASGKVPLVSSSGVTDYHSVAMAKGPGVVTGRYGTLGQVFYITDDFWPLNTTLYVRDFKGNDPRFVSYFLRSLNFLAYSDKAAVPGLNRNHLHQALVRVPIDLNEQRAIAHILSTLDDKIELNRRMNETLETMARALFKSWFVDFDPVRAKAEELIKAGILEIGDGYRAKNSELGEPGLPFIRAGNLNNGFDTAGAEVLKDISVAKAGTKISRPGDIAFTSKGTIGRFARVTSFTDRFVYSPQVCFWRSLDHSKIRPEILYCWMQSDDLKSQIEAVAGQTDMAPYVSLRDQRQMDVPIFPEPQHVVAGLIEPLLDRQASTTIETKTLGALRETLLPKLISGELRVKDAERAVEVVA